MNHVDPSLIKGLAIGLGAIGPAIGVGLIGSSAVGAIGRNPEMQGRILSTAFIMAGLVDAAMDTLRAELDEYAEFCRFRHAEAARIGLAASALSTDREHWRRECEHEMLLEQQLRRVRDSRYGETGDAPAGFRIR